MMMPGRQYNSTGYRYGFNGKENDNEVKGTGNSVDYGLRVYDPRIGKFLSADPLSYKFPYYSPYHFAGNSPIMNLDLDGAEDISYMYKQNREGSGYSLIGKTDYRNIDGGKGGSQGHGVQVIMINNKGEVRKEFMPTYNFSNESVSLSNKIGKALEKPASAIEKIIPKGNYKESVSYEGDEGMLKGAELLDNTGSVLKASVIGAPLGEGLSLMSDAMKTGLDFKNKDIKTATENLLIRGASQFTGKVLDKAVDGIKGVSKATKEAVKIVNDKAIDYYKDEATQDKKK